MSKPILQDFYEFSSVQHGASEEPVWDARAKRWVAMHPATVTHILRSEDFEVFRHHELLQRLEAARGINLAETVQSSSVMPLSHDGPRHRELKRLATQLMQAVTDSALEKFTVHSEAVLSRLLETRDRFDIVQEYVLPATARLFSAMTGVDEREFQSQVPSGHCPSQLLSIAKDNLSTSRWKAINNRVSERLRLVDGTPLEKLILGSLSLITLEIFKAAIANSLIKVIRGRDGRRIDEMDWPEQLPSTSIPFLDRVCRTDTEIGGRMLRKGDPVILYMGGCAEDDAEQRKLFFGTGPHICIGKSITEGAWRSLVSILRKRKEIVRINSVGYRDFDVVLISPSNAEVEVVR